jgi:hypothetical protein
LLEVAKRFAKYHKDEIQLDFETGSIQDFCNIINEIIHCCEDNNWFKE